MIIPAILGTGLLSLVAALFFYNSVGAIKVMEGAANPEEGKRLEEIAQAIREGAMAFLRREYTVLAGFILVFAAVIAVLIDDPHTQFRDGLYSAVAFILGAATSILSGAVGMLTATKGNVRTAVAARESLARGFTAAIQAGAVMGFGLSGLAILGLLGCYMGLTFVLPEGSEAHVIMEILTGFGLGGSTVALFARVGGGIYTKAADVGADLVGKVEAGIPEDDPRNPAVIADNVGDNVGDVAGMGADLFGSVAESTCAALVIGSTAFAGPGDLSALLYPIAISCLGIPSSLIAIMIVRARTEAEVYSGLKRMLLIATVIMAVAGYFLTMQLLPSSFQLGGKTITSTGVAWSFLAGLISGLLIGYTTEFFTASQYKPVQEVAQASTTGTATNIIYGLALGYNSAVIPAILIAITLTVAISLAGMYGIALSAIGMLGTIAVALTIDAYGPVADNAGGLAEMAHMGADIRKRTDILDSAGNTTAAIGKGFAIGSAALTAMALFSAYITQCKTFDSDLAQKGLDLLDPLVLAGLLVGGALTCAFSAMTMRSVGLAALSMIEEVRRQFRSIPGLLEGTGRADYARCVDIATAASLREMMAPGLMVIVTPILVGWLFGVKMLSGVLVGALVTAVMFAVSMANSGGAWDNAKKYIEAGNHGGRGTEAHKAAVVGDTVGDPFKDTSGPALNILIKLMAIISLVFAPFVALNGGVLLQFFH